MVCFFPMLSMCPIGKSPSWPRMIAKLLRICRKNKEYESGRGAIGTLFFDPMQNYSAEWGSFTCISKYWIELVLRTGQKIADASRIVHSTSLWHGARWVVAVLIFRSNSDTVNSGKWTKSRAMERGREGGRYRVIHQSSRDISGSYVMAQIPLKYRDLGSTRVGHPWGHRKWCSGILFASIHGLFEVIYILQSQGTYCIWHADDID